ncbi:hypothetical protein FEM48_Zijuj04G0079700 [Ziziphus jujuba var. spinosa]|uniref:Protein artemis n=1 Tax=Ziziphus jujuba var. spinosa TaxID=714518 RepID=A0A978VIQ0_ZIZJJ|nr:hypothetical protein FEM48_Zijuj04G0079700 [Ziziphus jujuba var. spinosa]
MEKGLIAVDRWTGGSQIYFLTHLHSDHTKGLSSSWSKGPIFCSRLTAKIFPSKFPCFNLSLLRVLEIGSWHSIPVHSPSTGLETSVEVMPIDAHHCPGAVMFLFRGEFGCLLYTGDFRWETTNERAKIGMAMLLNAVDDVSVDLLYLDNTYCNPSYDFPPREVAAQQIVDIIASHPDHDIIIGIDSLGKEDLLLHISHVLKIKIWVWPERLETMHLLGYHDIFTTKTSLARVRAVPRYSFSIETLEGLNAMRPTIGIMPSGMPWVLKPYATNKNLSGSSVTPHYNKCNKTGNEGIWTDRPNGNLESVERFHKYMFSVSYSDHSCFSEIEQFIKLVKPINVKGIVSSSSYYADPLYYFGRLCGVNQPAKRLHKKYEYEEGDETTPRKKSNFGSSNITSVRKGGRNLKVKYLGAQVSRVNTYRRVRCGAKIVEYEHLD